MTHQTSDLWAQLAVLMRTVQPTTEWIAFAARTDHLLDPDTPLRNPEHISYPGKDDPSVIPVHQGILERKHRFTKSYKEGFYVLTPAGYLHEYRSSDLSRNPHPELSLFLPECTLGAPSTVSSRSHKFHLETGKKSSGGMPFQNHLEYSFRARSHDEMMEWWNDAKQLSKVYRASRPSINGGANAADICGMSASQSPLPRPWTAPDPCPPPSAPWATLRKRRRRKTKRRTRPRRKRRAAKRKALRRKRRKRKRRSTTSLRLWPTTLPPPSML